MKKILALVLALLVAIPAAGAYAESEPAKAVPMLTTASPQNNFIKVALSQEGYMEGPDGESIYSDWLGQYGHSWCSEFAAWSAYKAGIPEDVIPRATSVRKFRDFFSAKGAFYIVEGGACNGCECSSFAAGTITIDEIKPGDIAFLEFDDNNATGDDHTAIVVSVGEGLKNGYPFINTIEGNTTKTGDMYSSVGKRKRELVRIHGICRPDYYKVSYDQIGVVKPGLTKVISKKTDTVKWKAVEGVEGYKVYRATSKKGTYKLVKTVKGAEKYKCSVTNAKHRKYYYKICTYNTYEGVKYRSAYSNILCR